MVEPSPPRGMHCGSQDPTARVHRSQHTPGQADAPLLPSAPPGPLQPSSRLEPPVTTRDPGLGQHNSLETRRLPR